MEKRVVAFGEVMMRLSTPDNQRFTQANHMKTLYAGSEANVVASLAVFGDSAEMVTVVPENDLGLATIDSIRKNGVITDHILIEGDRLGLYFLETGAAQRSSKIVYDRFNSAFSEIKPGSIDWDSIMKEASWFHWSGITPAVSQGAATVCAEAIASANKHGVTVSGDINYRRNLWQYGKSAHEIMPDLIAGTHIIIAGLEDFKNCLSIDEPDYEKACRVVCEKYPQIRKISTTYRETVNATHNKLYGVMWDGRKLSNSQTHDIYPIIDRVGAGDAYMAGLIYGWTHGMNDMETLEFGVAAGVLKHSVEGDVNYCSVDDVKQLAKGENIGKLLR
ncbi:MAG: sugar kinase [Cyclobacteriaceae bacterium]|nr:sugar kinase [Cyclobacteriaceae bacterium]